MTTPSEGVQRALDEHAERLPGVPILIACSGGPDSLALVHLAVTQRRSAAITPIHVCVIDHQAQADSAEVAANAVRTAEQLGADCCHRRAVEVGAAGIGFEAAARAERRRALEQCADEVGADDIWLGHTLDDQAETVLLGLARGSGARSLMGMAEREGRWVRPLLDCRRAEVHASLPADITAWQDPHNTNPAFLRSRVRNELMPVLADVLGAKSLPALARTAALLRDDNAALDHAASLAADALCRRDGSGIELDRRGLRNLSTAITHRLLRAVLIEAGCPPAELTMAHYLRIDEAIAAHKLVGPLAMPGGVDVVAQGDSMRVSRLGVKAASDGS